MLAFFFSSVSSDGPGNVDKSVSSSENGAIAHGNDSPCPHTFPDGFIIAAAVDISIDESYVQALNSYPSFHSSSHVATD